MHGVMDTWHIGGKGVVERIDGSIGGGVDGRGDGGWGGRSLGG